MKYKSIHITFQLLSLLICLLSLSNCRRTTEQILDDDILTLLMEKPDQLEFIECKTGSGQCILSAEYRVSGENAHIIEDFLHKNYNMSKLKFTCCGWETPPPNGSLKITDDFNKKYSSLYEYNHISISMYSPETLLKDRDKWGELPYFSVVVEVLNI